MEIKSTEGWSEPHQALSSSGMGASEGRSVSDRASYGIVEYREAPFGTGYGTWVHVRDNIWGETCHRETCACGREICKQGEVCGAVPIDTSTCPVSNVNCDDRYLEFRPAYHCFCGRETCLDGVLDLDLCEEPPCPCTAGRPGETCDEERGVSKCGIRSCLEGECRDGICLCGKTKRPCQPGEQCIDGVCMCRGKICGEGETCGYTGCVCGNDAPVKESSMTVPDGYPFVTSCGEGSCANGHCMCGKVLCNKGETCRDGQCVCGDRAACAEGFYCMDGECRCTDDPLHYPGLESCGTGTCHEGKCACPGKEVCRLGEMCVFGACDNKSANCGAGEYFSDKYGHCLCAEGYDASEGETYPYRCGDGKCIQGLCMCGNKKMCHVGQTCEAGACVDAY